MKRLRSISDINSDDGTHTCSYCHLQLGESEDKCMNCALFQLEYQNEGLWAIRDSLTELLEPDEPHDLGGPHISIPWVIAKFDALREVDYGE